MSSRFAPSKQSIKVPAVCIKPRPNLPEPYPTGIPNALHAFATWVEAAIPVHLAESFPLYYDAEIPGWKGASATTGSNLEILIEILVPAHTYDFKLRLRDGLTPVDDDSWHNVELKPPPPWDSGLLQHFYPFNLDRNSIHVLD